MVVREGGFIGGGLIPMGGFIGGGLIPMGGREGGLGGAREVVRRHDREKSAIRIQIFTSRIAARGDTVDGALW